MTKQIVDPGSVWDIVTPTDLESSLSKHGERLVSAIQQEQYRGIKPMRFRNNFTLGNNQTQVVQGPRAGYVWSVRRVSIWTTGTSQPVNLFVGTDSNTFQQNGFIVAFPTIPAGQVFSSHSLIVNPDEYLQFVSGATGPGAISVNGFGIEVPAEMVGKLLS